MSATRIMREARTLLLAGRGVAEVARKVGYRSPTSFSAAFARMHGLSPARWRDAARAEVKQVVPIREIRLDKPGEGSFEPVKGFLATLISAPIKQQRVKT